MNTTALHLAYGIKINGEILPKYEQVFSLVEYAVADTQAAGLV